MKKLLHYDITKKLGEGKHGEVNLAWDSGLDRIVAIKDINKALVADEDREQFLDDMNALSRLNDTHIAVFYSLELVNGRQYIIREYIEGDTIKELIRTQPLTYDRFLALARQLVETLQHTHGHGLLHLNITSQNVFVTSKGQTKLVDFRLPLRTSPEAADEIKPSDLVYLAPEQFRSDQADQRTDLYSLGVVFYEMLTGRVPFPTDGPAAAKQAILDGQPDLTRDEVRALPSEAQLLLKKLLARDPDDRFSGTTGLLATLKGMQSFQQQENRSPYGVSYSGSARLYLLLAVLMALLLVLWFVVTTLYK